MRRLTAGEKTKRGCRYCTDLTRKYESHGARIYLECPHEKCPHTVLDKYDTYEDYLKSKDSRINISAFVEAVEDAGRLTDSAWVNIPVLRRLGKGPLF